MWLGDFYCQSSIFFSFISLCHLVYQISVALFVLSLCPFDISVGIGAFVIGLGQISSVLSHNTILSMHNTHKTMTMVPFGVDDKYYTHMHIISIAIYV